MWGRGKERAGLTGSVCVCVCVEGKGEGDDEPERVEVSVVYGRRKCRVKKISQACVCVWEGATPRVPPLIQSNTCVGHQQEEGDGVQSRQHEKQKFEVG